ncbi:hypothetical protein ACEWPM_000460 [Roseovarius sp. S4756]|uniref:hypothetical protein n=1 Tax=Roseovarius maritimus TaxID=3342637 RepID=UPI00372BD72E
MRLHPRAVLAGLAAALVAPTLRWAAAGHPLSINPAPMYHCSTQLPIVGVFKTVRRWIGHLPGRWGARDDAPRATADGGSRPGEAFVAYAFTGFFGHIVEATKRRGLIAGWLAESLETATKADRANGLADMALGGYVAARKFHHATPRATAELRGGAKSGHTFDMLRDLLNHIWPRHVGVARRHGLSSNTSEGGSQGAAVGRHIDDDELTALLVHLSYSPEMSALYDDVRNGGATLEAGTFTQYNDVASPGTWGSSGAMRWPCDDNPRRRALGART